jgi:hypothetical protein
VQAQLVQNQRFEIHTVGNRRQHGPADGTDPAGQVRRGFIRTAAAYAHVGGHDPENGQHSTEALVQRRDLPKLAEVHDSRPRCSHRCIPPASLSADAGRFSPTWVKT